MRDFLYRSILMFKLFILSYIVEYVMWYCYFFIFYLLSLMVVYVICK